MSSWTLHLLRFLPKNLISRAFGWWARRQRPRFLVRPFMRWFAGRFGIDLSEAEAPFEHYRSLHELFVRRQYVRLVPRETLLAGPVFERVPLRAGEPVTSGERIEVVVTLEAKNELEYLLVEDLKPAGFEAVEQQSGRWMVARELRVIELRPEERSLEDVFLDLTAGEVQ